MKTRINRSFAAAMVLAAVFMNGCVTKSPLDQWYEAQDSMNTVRLVINSQYEAGNISDKDLLAIGELEKAARVALEGVRPQAEAGQPGLHTTLAIVRDTVAAMKKHLAEHNTKGK